MDQDPTFAPSEEYDDACHTLPHLTETELRALVGAIVAELVNRGNDTQTALDAVIKAARGGAEGSRAFDRMDT